MLSSLSKAELPWLRELSSEEENKSREPLNKVISLSSSEAYSTGKASEEDSDILVSNVSLFGDEETEKDT